MEPGIDWRPWGKRAFDEARQEGKPVLLDLSAAWCHWCHVMDKTSFSDPDVVRLINAKFIPVRVDIDRRPDIRDRYNFGGYPTVAVLNEKGHVLTGATYVPPRQLEQMLREIHKIYIDRREQMQLAPAEERKHPEPGMGEVDENIVPFVTSVLVNGFDAEMGGFGEPKFPAPAAVSLLLLDHARTGDAKYLEMARTTLDSMKRLLDETEGGFYRYSVTRDWKTPHYEKMLDTNAGVLLNYLDAYAVTGDAEYRRVAQRVLNYVDATLCGKDDGFYASQDADEEYYRLPLAERKRRKAPSVDRTVYADINGRMISAYLRAASVLGEAKYRDIALKSLRTVMRLFKGKEGMYHHEDGEPSLPGMAADNVRVMRACIDAYEHTADMDHLTHAEKLAAFIAKNLVDRRGLRDRATRPDDIGELKSERRPLEENAVAADAFTSLASLTDNEKYLKTAETILLGMSSAFEMYGHFAAGYAVAVDHFLHPVKVAIVGKTGEQKTRKLWQAALRPFNPRRSVLVLDVEKDKKRIERYPTNRLPAAFLCEGKTCEEPILDADGLAERLKRFK